MGRASSQHTAHLFFKKRKKKLKRTKRKTFGPKELKIWGAAQLSSVPSLNTRLWSWWEEWCIVLNSEVYADLT